jgi:hypothetical protein
MLTVRVSTVAVCAVLLAACGDDETKDSAQVRCPDGTAELSPADVLPSEASLVPLPDKTVAEVRPLVDRRFGDRGTKKPPPSRETPQTWTAPKRFSSTGTLAC